MDIADPAISSMLENILAEAKAIRLRATGHSMQPFLQGGELLTIQRVAPSAVRRGDLLLYRSRHGRLLIHRVLCISQTKASGLVFTLQGDARPVVDEPVRAAQVLGWVCAIEREVSGAGVRYLDLESWPWRAYGCCVANIQLVRHYLRGPQFSLRCWLSSHQDESRS
jgi:signal peptidase I